MVKLLFGALLAALVAITSLSGPVVIGTIRVGSAPTDIVVNTVTNKIYVADDGRNSNNVTVIDGKTGHTTLVKDPNARGPYALALNARTNTIYVVNNRSANLSVIDGRTNALTIVHLPNAKWPYAVAVDAATNRAYVANYLSRNVSVIAGAKR
jgi:DNA-binding beta-propeller fold protein YncE